MLGRLDEVLSHHLYRIWLASSKGTQTELQIHSGGGCAKLARQTAYLSAPTTRSAKTYSGSEIEDFVQLPRV
ncbi:uncharacterized protein ALTATR162_LOCUS1247 [Alternaria atra]|uniref:Uncharacterized protein n=1 Tax=Alternaria atra TaxID=119953 RepID=A0A8J2HXX7_9PLEO|nr:uncharacterized protein ALTATR162_LOCUS1247 [Alternaria atra]CAG5142909.1 unnamed protein product [Alternaria atra]